MRLQVTALGVRLAAPGVVAGVGGGLALQHHQGPGLRLGEAGGRILWRLRLGVLTRERAQTRRGGRGHQLEDGRVGTRAAT